MRVRFITPGLLMYLEPDCSIMGICWLSMAVNGGKKVEKWKKLRHHVREYNWDGEVVWEYLSDTKVHHDTSRLANGNTLFLAQNFKKLESLDPSGTTKDLNENGRKIRGDKIVEVDSSGGVVWQWDPFEHLDPLTCGARECQDKGEKELLEIS